MISKRALVTGGTGFIGSSLCYRLVDNGWDVCVLYRQESSLAHLETIRDRIQTYKISNDIDSVIHIFDIFRPKIVFHLAAQYTPTESLKELCAALEANICFGTYILEAMCRSNTRYIVSAGTYWQNACENSMGYSPRDFYSATKQAFKDLLDHYTQNRGLHAVTLRLFDSYSEDDPRKKILQLFVQAAKEKTVLKMSPGEQKIDLLHVDDLASAFVHAAHLLFEQNSLEPIYDVSSGTLISLRELALVFQDITGCVLNIEWGALPYRKHEIMNPKNRYQILPGWSSTISLREGLARIRLQENLYDTM